MVLHFHQLLDQILSLWRIGICYQVAINRLLIEAVRLTVGNNLYRLHLLLRLSLAVESLGYWLLLTYFNGGLLFFDNGYWLLIWAWFRLLKCNFSLLLEQECGDLSSVTWTIYRFMNCFLGVALNFREVVCVILNMTSWNLNYCWFLEKSWWSFRPIVFCRVIVCLSQHIHNSF